MREKTSKTLVCAMQFLAVSIIHNVAMVSCRPAVSGHVELDATTRVKTTNLLYFFHFSTAIFNF